MSAPGDEPLLIDIDAARKIATVTLNRPEALNALNQPILEAFDGFWRAVREDETVNAVIVRAAPDSRAFTSGVDVRGDGPVRHPNVFVHTGVQAMICPRMHYVYKPVICAVHGICAGAGLFLVNDSDLTICSEDAEFFDPHLAIGITSAMGPIGMARRVNLGEVLRYTLLSNAERLSAATALRIGLVTEVTPREALWARADELAAIVAGYNPVAVQGTLKAIWESQDLGLRAALDRASLYSDAARSTQSPSPSSPAPRRPHERR
jgi:enoyl-CoA hydratase/carnithine racemase